MKKYNFLPGAPNPSGWSGNPPERLSPQAKRLAIIGGVAIVLVGAVYLYTRYFSAVPPPPPRAATTATPATIPTSPLIAPSQSKQVEPEPQAPQVEIATPKPTTPPPMAAQTEIPPMSPRPTAGPSESIKSGGEGVEERPPRSETGLPVTKPLAPPRPEKPFRSLSPTDSTGGKRPFTLQVASLVIRENALALEKRLGDLGYTPVVRAKTAPISQHRVYGGEFNSRQEAERTARRLNVDGFPSKLVEGEDGKFRLEIGSYYVLNKAIDLAHALQEKRYTPKIHSQTVPSPVYQVQVGGYDSRVEAAKALEALKKQGFTPIVVRR